FFHEERIGGELEALGAMRLQAEQREVARHRALGDCGLLGHRAHAPMGGVFGLAAQDPIDQSRYLLVAVGARTSGPQFIVQAGDTVLDKAPAPLAHRRHAPAQTLCDGEVARATIACGSEREAASADTCACSSALNTSSVVGRPTAIGISP